MYYFQCIDVCHKNSVLFSKPLFTHNAYTLTILYDRLYGEMQQNLAWEFVKYPIAVTLLSEDTPVIQDKTEEIMQKTFNHFLKKMKRYSLFMLHRHFNFMRK